jgi:hypothetical protein
MPSYATLPNGSPAVRGNITQLINDIQGYQTVRTLRWPEGMACPSCASPHGIQHVSASCGRRGSTVSCVILLD